MSATDSHSTALSRSLASLPSDYRARLEASNLPIEIAVAIADAVDVALRSEKATSREAVLEEALRQIRTICHQLTLSSMAVNKRIGERDIVQIGRISEASLERAAAPEAPAPNGSASSRLCDNCGEALGEQPRVPTCWLVERVIDGRHAWWTGANSESFDYDPNQAVRFCRHSDAFWTVRNRVNQPYKITEHLWLDERKSD